MVFIFEYFAFCPFVRSTHSFVFHCLRSEDANVTAFNTISFQNHLLVSSPNGFVDRIPGHIKRQCLFSRASHVTTPLSPRAIGLHFDILNCVCLICLLVLNYLKNVIVSCLCDIVSNTYCQILAIGYTEFCLTRFVCCF